MMNGVQIEKIFSIGEEFHDIHCIYKVNRATIYIYVGSCPFVINFSDDRAAPLCFRIVLCLLIIGSCFFKHFKGVLRINSKYHFLPLIPSCSFMRWSALCSTPHLQHFPSWTSMFLFFFSRGKRVKRKC